MQAEDVFVQLWRNARLFDDGVGGGALSSDASGCSLATASSKYGICLALAPGNRIASAYGMLLINGPNVNNENLRFVDYPDEQCEIVHLGVSHGGEILAVGINRSGGGAFVELFDVQAFDPKCQQQAFPLASVRVSTDGVARIIAFSWNPCQNSFAVSTSDGTLATIQYELTDGASFTVLASQSMKSKVTCISWSPKGKQLTAGDADGRLHQLKQELAVRTIEAPNGSATKRCVNVYWLSTTEWLVAYADSTDDTPTVAFLTVKKQQPPSWAFIDGAVERNANADKPATLRFCPLLDWQLVFICSSVSITGTVIAFTGNEWRRLNIPIVLPKENENTTIYPVGCAFDVGNILPVFIAGQQISPQPVFHVLTSTGWLTSYNVVSLIERPIVVKVPQIIDVTHAKFGNPPVNYNPRKPSDTSTLAAAQHNNTSQSQPSSANHSTQFDQSLDMVAIRGSKSTTNANAMSSSTNVLTAGGGVSGGEKTTAQQQPLVAASLNTQPVAIAAEKPVVDPLVAQYVRSLDSYCKLRNMWTHEIDLVRELRGAIGDLVPDVESSIDSLAQMGDCSRDLYNLIHDSRKQLLEYELRVDESEELAQKMSVIRDFVGRDHEQIERELDDRLVEFGKRTGDIDVKLSKLRIQIRKAQEAQQNEKPVSPLDVKESKECTLNTRRVGTWVARSYADLQYTIGLVTELRGRVTLAQRAGKLPDGSYGRQSVTNDKNLSAALTPGTPAHQAADCSLISSVAINSASTTRDYRRQLNGTSPSGSNSEKYIDGLQTQVLHCLQLGDRLEVHARRTVASEETATEKTNVELIGVRGRLNQVVGTPNRLEFVSIGTQSPKVVVRPKPAAVNQESKAAIITAVTTTSNYFIAPTTLPSAQVNNKVVFSSMATSTVTTSTVDSVAAPIALSSAPINNKVVFSPMTTLTAPTSTMATSTIMTSTATTLRTDAAAVYAALPSLPVSSKVIFSPTATSAVTTSAAATSKTVDAVAAPAAPAALPSTPVSSKVVFSPNTTTPPMTTPTNTSPSFVSFSFKPPTVTSGTNQQPNVPVSGVSITNADEGMDEDGAATATGVTAAPTGGVTFSFNSMGLGAQKPVEPAAVPKNVFNMFSGNKPQGSSIFGGGSTSGSSFFNAAPTNGALAVGGGSSLFGGGSSTGAAVSVPSGGQGSSLFGGGATFGSASPFNAAGAGTQSTTSSPFVGKAFGTSVAGQQKTFGIMAATSSGLFGGSPTTSNSPFGGGAATVCNMPFGGSGATNSPFANSGKSSFGGGGTTNSTFGGGQTSSFIFGGGAKFGGGTSQFQQHSGGSPLVGKPSAFTQMRK